jgi:glucose-1-phosphate thymidylyltransferase
MESLKGLILSGGAGTRLRPITHTSAKQLVPVANKPVLFYGIEALVAAGIDEIVIVIAPETGAEIREAAGDGTAFGARITYVEQEAPLGLAHAVLTAEDALGGQAFAMYLGDNLLRDGITELVDSFRHDDHDALLLLTQVPDPWHYGVAELDGERIVRLVEKPESPPSDLALVGVYLFGPKIFEAARAIEPSGRGELEITDAIQHLIDDGSQVESRTVSGWWKDTGQLADMLEANRLVLEDLVGGVEGELVASRVEGRVAVAPGARIERSRIRGPAIIGADATIVDAYVGPYTSVGERVTIERSEVEHSILLADCTVKDLESRMEASLLGRSVKLTRSESRPRTLSMIVGDRSEITLP